MVLMTREAIKKRQEAKRDGKKNSTTSKSTPSTEKISNVYEGVLSDEGVTVKVKKTFPSDYFHMVGKYGNDLIYSLALWAAQNKFKSAVRGWLRTGYNQEEIKKKARNWKPKM